MEGGGGWFGKKSLSFEVLQGEPYIPRPIVSLHVRQGDKAQEMRIMSFDVCMLGAHRLREFVPDLKHVWLSTEMQVRQCVNGKLMAPLCVFLRFHRIPVAASSLSTFCVSCCALQSVIDSAKDVPHWTFFHTNIPRQSGDVPMASYEEAVGADIVIGDSFANLIIASQCDYFVGVLGSNWNRLINELRSTNGRLYSGYIALNADQW